MSVSNHPGHKLKYRPDIDGLRAIAVVSVLAFHLKTHMFLGGYVGVDVFFVISGYLIGSIILKGIREGTFSIASFYENRVRRIAPALVGALVGTSVLAYIYFLPSELVDFSKSLLSALFSVSNFYFWKDSGYFTAPVDTKPLIHTWSLGVEEQFYLLLPIFLVLLCRYFPKRVRGAVLGVAVLSLVLSAIGAFTHPDPTFYLLPTRAWELLLGVLIPLGLFPEIRKTASRNAAAFTGIALIFLALMAFTQATPFPGLSALLPCFGTALVIMAGEFGDSWVSRALSLKPVVFVGLISYSLYLWHWPIIVFQGTQSMLISGLSVRTSKLICIAVSFVVAILSWRFIERPFRKRHQAGLSRRTVFTMAATAAALIAALGVTTLMSRGFPGRYPANALQVASYLDYSSSAYAREGSCFITSNYTMKDFDFAKCLSFDSKKQNDLLLGDSHAAHLWYGLSHTLAGTNLLQATASGCRPTIEQDVLAADTCKILMRYVFSDFLPTHHIDRLIIADRWKSEDLSALSSTLDWTTSRHIPVLLTGPMVQYDTSLPRLLAFSIRANDPAIAAIHRLDQRKLDDAFALLAQTKGVSYISFYHTLCQGNSCVETDPKGVPLEFDYGHLTKEGSLFVAQRLFENGDLRLADSPQTASAE
jgi:peptidoglycan/LPS O-acetylase OafA/YrhL